MNIAQVHIKRVQVGAREYDAVRLWINGMAFQCDVVSDSTIRQAKEIADSTGATFMYDEPNAARCREVLGIKANEKD